ncbi:MAG: hypothetical protein JNJ45_07305 [Chthonomonas sp.]|nr:hypothetical protein [Chthonomonas sp.]
MKLRQGSWMILGLVTLVGCSRSGPPVYPTWSPQLPQYEPRDGAGGFDSVCLAGQGVEESLDGKQLSKFNFTDRDKELYSAKVAPQTERMIAALAENPRYEFRPTPPLERPKFVGGWRLIGESLIWRTEAAVKAKNPAEAVRMFTGAARFCRLMMQGDANTAQMGLHVLDGSRAALGPALVSLGASNLQKLVTVVEETCSAPSFTDAALKNESAQALAALQFFQDAYAAQNWKRLEDNFETVGRDASRLLKAMEPTSSKRVELFDKLKERIDTELSWQLARAAVPAAKRPQYPKLGGGEFGRLWISTFGMAGRGVITSADTTLARCRLLALTAHMQALASQKQPLPRDLSALPKWLRNDPVSGVEFVYRTNGVEFDCYSRGADGRDDLGRTDEPGLNPDLRLER